MNIRHALRNTLLTLNYIHFENRKEAARIHQHYGDTALFDYSQIGPGVDFCLIDAAHSYEYVRNDTAMILPLMSDNSLLLWHDYGRNDFLVASENAWGVTRFLHEIAEVGVAILKGTSLGVLLLTIDTRNRLAQRLGVTLT